MSLISNERLKLFATYLNGLAIAVFAVGGLAPAFSALYGSMKPASGLLVTAVSFGCFAASGALHYAGNLVLKGLQP